jgi:hypothetical protein
VLSSNNRVDPPSIGAFFPTPAMFFFCIVQTRLTVALTEQYKQPGKRRFVACPAEITLHID